jgi:CheY-like chemotaxis protein
MQRHLILIVEDDTSIQKMVAAILSREGYSWIAANDGAQAIRLLDSSSPICLVLLDLMMPRVSGVEVIRHLLDEGSDIPVVVMTAAVHAVRQEQLDPEIVRAVITKPFTLEHLRSTIETFAEDCRRHSAGKESVA